MPTVGSLSALHAALAVNANTDITLSPGTYTGDITMDSSYASRTNPVIIRCSGVTLQGRITFRGGSHDQEWLDLTFANITVSQTGVIVFGGYAGEQGPHHITLRRPKILASVLRATAGSTNEHGVYFSYALGNWGDILIEDFDVTATATMGLATAIHGDHGYPSDAPLVTARRVTVRRTVFRGNGMGNGASVQAALILWVPPFHDWTFDGATITNANGQAVRFESVGASNILFKDIFASGSNIPYYSSMGDNPPGVTFINCSWRGGTQTPTGTATLSKGWTTAAAGKVGARGPSAVAFRFATAAAGNENISTTGTANLSKGWSTTATGMQGLSAVTGTSAASFRFTPSGVAKVSFSGQSAVSFGWAAGGVGKPGYTGVGALAKGFSTAAVGAQSISGGVSATSFRFATAGVGNEKISGTSASSFRFSTAGVGSWTFAGVAASSFTFSTAAAGVLSLSGGVSASAFRFSSAAVGTEAITGTGASSFGWRASRNEGPAASTFGWSTMAIGAGLAPSASTFTWTTSAVGSQGFTGTGASSFGWSTTGASSQNVVGTSASSFTHSIAATGALALSGGLAASEFGWSTSGASELAVATGNAASSFGWSAAAVAEAIAEGSAASSFGWSAAGVAVALGASEGLAASSFGWSTDAAGTEVLPPPQYAASSFLWGTSGAGSVAPQVAGLAASAFLWGAAGAAGTSIPVPPPRPRRRGWRHWPGRWLDWR